MGREDEQAVTDRLVVGARVGQGGALVVTGEPGIGKTALLEHAVAAADGMQVLQAVGTRSERDLPFASLLQLLRPTLGLLDRIPERQAEALAVALALRSGEPGDRFAIGAAVLSLLSRYGEDGPLLLALDDAQVMDLPSLEAIVFAARRLTTDPVAVLVSSRPEPDLPSLLTALPRLALGGLDEAATVRLLTGRHWSPSGEEAVHRLHRATGGNPLALLELGRDLEGIDRVSPAVPLPVPEVVADSLRRRVARLGTASRTVLLVAAIAGDDLAVLSAATRSLGADVTHLAEAEAAGLVDLAPGHVRFRHPLARSSAYAAAPPALRRRAHRAVARHLPSEDLERRTWHLSEAAVGPDAALADDLDRVGGRARRRSAYSVAATAHERSALLSPDRSTQAGRLFSAGEAAWLAGQPDRADDLLARASGLTHDRHRLAAVDGLRGAIASRAGSLETGRRMLVGAGRTLAEGDPAGAARILAEAVTTCLWLADAPGAAEVTSLLEALDRERLDDRTRSLVDLSVGVGMVLSGADGIGRIREALSRMSTVDPWRGDPWRPVASLLGVLFLRETTSGRGLLRRIVEDLRDRAAVATIPELLLLVARDEATTDRWPHAVVHYEECRGLAREAGQTTTLTLALAGVSSLHARTGREAACRETADSAIDLAGRHHVHLATTWASWALGDLELGLGRPTMALTHYTTVVDLVAENDLDDVDVHPGPELVDCLLRAHRYEEAEATARRYHARALAKGQPWACARAERAMGMVVDESAEHHFAEALRLHALTVDTYEEARTQLALGSYLRRQRRRIDARPQLRSALESFGEIAAEPWADAAAAELAATGESPVRRSEGAVARLTPQELQISRMLVEGRTTRQAAAALFLSPKTVEYHLRHVYTKLDIHSRDELAAALAEAAGPMLG